MLRQTAALVGQNSLLTDSPPFQGFDGMAVKKRTAGFAALKGDGRISIRLHPDVKTALESLAREDQRNLSSYLEKNARRPFARHARQQR
jgi:hypothetical protein